MYHDRKYWSNSLIEDKLFYFYLHRQMFGQLRRLQNSHSGKLQPMFQSFIEGHHVYNNGIF